jgi:uncharacterized protein YcbK (DUF882 family)
MITITGKMGNLSQHFDTKEFGVQCRCGCGFGSKVEDTNPELWQALEKLRSACGNKPIRINSCARCKTYNRSVGSTDTSQHVVGNAADIVVEGKTPREVANIAEEIWPDTYGIGRYSQFTHIDVRRNKARWYG